MGNIQSNKCSQGIKENLIISMKQVPQHIDATFTSRRNYLAPYYSPSFMISHICLHRPFANERGIPFMIIQRKWSRCMVSVLNKKKKELPPCITHLPPFLPGSSLKLMDAGARQIHGRSHPIARTNP